jgi:hypothetical protein
LRVSGGQGSERQIRSTSGRSEDEQRKEEQGDEAHADIGGWWHVLKLRCYIAAVSATTPGGNGFGDVR